MIVLCADQRTDEWRQARLGRLTGTSAADMLARVQKGEAAPRRDLRLRLVCERLTGAAQEDTYVSKDMQRGIDREPSAVAAYEALSGQLVKRVGFCAHDTLMAGCSPDGLIGTTGILEVKCPRSATHLRYLRTRTVPPEYLAQVMHNLWITGAEWCDFVSFDDRFPRPLRLFWRRHHRQYCDLDAYELAVRLFLSEVEKELEDVRQLLGDPVAA